MEIRYLFEYTGVKQDVILEPSKYLIRVWGAQGGYIQNKSAGRGAYTEAIFDVKSQTRLNIYVGGQGKCDTKIVSQNFYKAGLNDVGKNGKKSCSGGGSTFITVNNVQTDVLIASGSGGGSGYYEIENPGGYGGYIGENAPDLKFFYYHAEGGKQNRGGSKSHFQNNAASCDSSPGGFLKGGDANTCWDASAGGGGGGYYGGGGGVDVGSGGGGSSFVRSDLTSPAFYNGSQTFKSPSGSFERGHFGNGYIIIQSLITCSASKLCFNFNFSTLFLAILFDYK